jgi:hypothetical protein
VELEHVLNRLDSLKSFDFTFGASRSHSNIADGAENVWRDSTFLRNVDGGSRPVRHRGAMTGELGDNGPDGGARQVAY